MKWHCRALSRGRKWEYRWGSKAVTGNEFCLSSVAPCTSSNLCMCKIFCRWYAATEPLSKYVWGATKRHDRSRHVIIALFYEIVIRTIVYVNTPHMLVEECKLPGSIHCYLWAEVPKCYILLSAFILPSVSASQENRERERETESFKKDCQSPPGFFLSCRNLIINKRWHIRDKWCKCVMCAFVHYTVVVCVCANIL